MSIPIIKLFKESFQHVWKHRLEWTKVGFAPFIIWVLGLLPIVVVLSVLKVSPNAVSSYTENWRLLFSILAIIIFFLTSIIALTSTYINCSRYAALREGGDCWWTLHLNRRFMKLILYGIFIIILGGIYLSISFSLYVGTIYLFGSMIPAVMVGLFLALLAIYLYYRVGLSFLLIALDHKKPMKLSWYLL